ncbi:MAG: hypothetical protein JWN41_1437, partial [Thermoleophilia bacterium]|nr:hypothetical protein [Thermoleophilia bacterium]
MSGRRSIVLGLMAVVVAVTIVGAHADAAVKGGAAGSTVRAATAAVGTTTATRPSNESQRLQRELGELASAWASAGGTYGYPYWDKARQRWHAGTISTSLFREYVAGYRDRMRLGCQLVDDVATSDGIAHDTQKLVRDACDERVQGLAAQQRWL